MRRLLAKVAFLLAASAVLLPRHERAASGGEGFPGWPDSFEGRALVEEPIEGREALFGKRFPGRIARFRAGGDIVLMRWTDRATHQVHPLAVCLRANGWEVEARPLMRRADGAWSAFRARKGARVIEVREQIRASDGKTVPDVSNWFWHAFFGLSTGPWLVISVVTAA